jgi:hypothetical protein
MSERTEAERQGTSEIMWVVLYSILVLLLMLVWVSGPAASHGAG